MFCSMRPERITTIFQKYIKYICGRSIYSLMKSVKEMKLHNEKRLVFFFIVLLHYRKQIIAKYNVIYTTGTIIY